MNSVEADFRIKHPHDITTYEGWIEHLRRLGEINIAELVLQQYPITKETEMTSANDTANAGGVGASTPTGSTLSDALHAATASLEPQSGDSSVDLSTAGVTISDGSQDSSIVPSTSAPAAIDNTDQAAAIAAALDPNQPPKYTVQRENLRAEMQSRKDSLEFAIATLNQQQATAEEKYQQRQKDLTDDYNTLTEAYGAQLTDAQEALDMVNKALSIPNQ